MFITLIIVFVGLYYLLKKVETNKPAAESVTDVARTGCSMVIVVVLGLLFIYIVAISPLAKAVNEIGERGRYEQRLNEGRKDIGR